MKFFWLKKINESWSYNVIFFVGNTSLIFITQKRLWKSEFCNLWGDISNLSMYQRPFKIRKCLLQFDAEVAEKFLNVNVNVECPLT